MLHKEIVMLPLEIDGLGDLSEAQVAHFREHGFLAVDNVLRPAIVEQLRGRFSSLFAGDFETGIYPDEWYWREELSRPDVTRHMANAWKADLSVAALSLSSDIGKAACRLTGWTSAKLGQDTIWWKPPGGKPVAYHQDTSFMDFLDPQQTVTFWFALDDVTQQTGTLEYARGSHRWPCTPMPSSFHAADDYRSQLRAAADAANEPMPDIYYAEVFTEASITARPFFERNGFEVIEAQDVELRGETFRNYRMAKALSAPI